jgi:putative ABC transport system permease protein
MWRNYLKIAVRNLLKYKAFSFINIIGLAIGIATSILIFLFVQYEFSYDEFYKNSDRIFRIAVDARIGNTEIHQTGTPAPMPAAMYKELPGIDKITRIFDMDEAKIQIQNKNYFEDDIFIVDSTFFEIFTLDIIDGQKENLLNEKSTAVIAKSFAEKYFQNKSPINEVIRINFYDTTFTPKIIAVVDDIPHNSHFHSNVFVSLVSTPKNMYAGENWFWNMFTTYIMLEDNVDYLDFEKKLPDFIRHNHFAGATDEELEERKAKGNKWVYFLQPLPSIHLNSNLNGEYEANGNETYVKIFILVAFFILLIASINFMNLSTAKSANRAKEVGVRKVLGATKAELMKQFLIESFVISLIALILGMVLIETILPYYRAFINKPIEIHYFDNIQVIPSLISLAAFIGIFSGIYPGVVLSQFRPIVVLKSNLVNGNKNSWFRNILVIFQFSIAIILIVGTIIIDKQVKLVQNNNLGFDKDQTLIIKNADILDDKIDVVKNELLKNSNIEHVTISSTLPGRSFSNIGFGADSVEDNFSLNLLHCDYDFLNTVKLEMVNGRFFSKEFKTDSSAIIINEAAAELLNFHNPIGKKVNNWNEPRDYFNIIGVVKNFHYESMHTKIRPQGILLIDGIYGRRPNFISCKLSTNNLSETISYANVVWSEYASDLPFTYSFLDRDYDALYDNEEQTKTLFTIFSMLTILIACLGILGLASFIAQQKTKEIGIRKVHGALLENIFVLLSKQFTRWVLIANIFAWPAAWFFMNNWLQNFVYRTEILWWFFIAAGVIAFVIAMLTVSFQSFSKARMNPVDALRYE